MNKGPEFGGNQFIEYLYGPLTWVLILILIACIDSIINLPSITGPGSTLKKLSTSSDLKRKQHSSHAATSEAYSGWASPHMAAPLWLQVSTFILPLAFYIRSTPESVGMVDAGALSLAAWLPGVAHPPGFPFTILFGHLAIRVAGITGFGLSPAYILNLTSSLGAALTVHLVWRCGRP